MNKFYLGIAVLLTSASITFGQTAKSRDAGTQSKGAGRHVSFFSESGIAAELQNTLDVKSAKVGDEVVLKTVKAVKQNGETVVPKGTRLLGRITEVQRRTKENGSSKLGMAIDRIEGKDLSAPITASIITITDVRSTAALNDALMTDSSASSSTSGSVSAGGSGGGLLGGVGNTVSGVTNTAGSTLGAVTKTVTHTVGSVTATAGQTVGSTTSLAGPTLSGIHLSNSARGSASGSTTLSSQNKNIRLEKGVTFHLAISSQTGN